MIQIPEVTDKDGDADQSTTPPTAAEDLQSVEKRLECAGEKCLLRRDCRRSPSCNCKATHVFAFGCSDSSSSNNNGNNMQNNATHFCSMNLIALQLPLPRPHLQLRAGMCGTLRKKVLEAGKENGML